MDRTLESRNHELAVDSGDRISRPARLALLAPAVLVIAVCLAGPLTLLLSYSFAPGGSTRANFSEGLTLENYVGVLGDTVYLGIILKTLWLSVIVTLAAIIVGWPLAYFLWKVPGQLKTLCAPAAAGPLPACRPLSPRARLGTLADERRISHAT